MSESAFGGLNENETADDLQNGYFIIQSRSGFRFGADAVLLSDFARIRKNEKVIDLGCGNGIIPVLLAAKTDCRTITGLEIQEESVRLARKSVALNHLEDRIHIVQGDIKEATALFGAASFHVVTCNPPYMIGSHGLKNPNTQAAIARHEILCTFQDVTKSAAALLENKGRFYLVHRPFRLAELFHTMIECRLEPKRMRLVFPFVDREPNMVLIEAVKGGNPRLKVEPPLIMYESEGKYSREILEIYGHPVGPKNDRQSV
ncbi:MAG: tRNA1(Val) (adenine(37)-N6)-methyltransferase [Bilifractor sp.]|jgi:tRNA1Val (adenine37-N6)-methyltransferase